MNSAQIFFVLWIFGPQYSMCNLDNSFVTVSVIINISSIDLYHCLDSVDDQKTLRSLCCARQDVLCGRVLLFLRRSGRPSFLFVFTLVQIWVEELGS